MITRDNIQDIVNLISDSDRESIHNSTREYVMMNVSFFNVGVSISIGLLSDLPLDYDEQVASGNVVFLETEEMQNML